MGKGGDAVYCFGLIGSLVYYLQHASNFSEGVMGVLKSFVWPALMVFRVLGNLNM